MRSAGTGVYIGIPLTLLQLYAHAHTPVSVLADPALVANNFALGMAIYDADRSVAPAWSAERAPTRAAALGAVAYYAAHPATQALAPTVLALHLGYTDVLKPRVATVKPFFVAALWTLCIYYAPLWLQDAHAPIDVRTPAHLFVSLAALSHAADVADIEEDARAGVRTVAVRMGYWEARHYAIALALASAVLDYGNPTALLLYDAPVLGLTLGLLVDNAALGLAITAALVGGFAVSHDVELLGEVLRSTEGSHRAAIALILDAVDRADALEPAQRQLLLDMAFRALTWGDSIGSRFLHVYEDAVRHRFGG